MSNTPHELAEEFPAEAALIHQKKAADPHFARLLVQYRDINRDVHRAETRIDTVSAQHEADLRHQRSALKDEIWRLLRAV